jgi:hypothetical protein
MAMDLKTKLTKKFSFQELITKAQDSLNVILNRDSNFQIIINATNEVVIENENRSLVAFTKEYPDEIVELSLIYQDTVPGYEDPDENGWWGYVTIRAANNSPMKYTLAAALISSLSEINNDLIWDENCIWSKNKVLSRSEFLEKIKISDSVSTNNEALSKFLKKIYNIRNSF